MPTYVYHCSLCGSEFETFQRITEDPLTRCPQGHEGTVKRVMQPVAVAFKGEGFHINDYAPKSAKESAGSSTPSPSSEAKTDGAATAADSAGATPKESAPAESVSTTPTTKSEP